MEYVDGSSLHNILRDNARKGQSIPLDRAVVILRDVLSGVAFAHDKNTIHRDLSPANILMTSTGIPKIGDFGIARVLEPPVTPDIGSPHGGTGNPNYISPEQLRGEDIDKSSDLFMIGIVGYILLTGRHPFAHPSGLFNIPDLIKDENYLPEPPRPSSSLTASQQRLFREYAAIVMRLLNREKAGRFSSAREAIDAIEAVTPFKECPQCGERVAEHYLYCGYCGAAFVTPTSTAPTPPTVPTSSPSPDHIDDLVEQGFQMSRLRRWDDAITLYNEALRHDPNHEKAHRNLGYVLNFAGRFEEAEKVLSHGLDLAPDQPSHEASFHHERAVARAELKNYDGALEDVQRAIELIPHSIKSLYLRAKIRLLRGERHEARIDALEVLKRIPDHAGALRLLDQASDF
jgi:serine/threonine protein kinase